MASKKTGHQPDNFSGFGFKLSFEKKKNVGIDHVRLEHTEGGHNKFYIIQLLKQGNSISTNFTVTITYGKMNTAGSVKRHGFTTQEDAYKFINKKMGEKIRKGYKRIINN
jgi:predicted DNA-binding WGR domain protein